MSGCPWSRVYLRPRRGNRWHPEIRAALDLESAVSTSDGFSFAEIEELKNLLVMHFMDGEKWDWNWALKQFAINRNELTNRPQRHAGFGNNVSRGNRKDDIPF
jgi:cell division protease FtsH